MPLRATDQPDAADAADARRVRICRALIFFDAAPRRDIDAAVATIAFTP